LLSSKDCCILASLFAAKIFCVEIMMSIALFVSGALVLLKSMMFLSWFWVFVLGLVIMMVFCGLAPVLVY
jgi:hypothetical protein